MISSHDDMSTELFSDENVEDRARGLMPRKTLTFNSNSLFDQSQKGLKITLEHKNKRE